MPPVKVSKKHQKHINNPFPLHPKTLPLIHGSLSFDQNTVPQDQVFQVGDDFQLSWSSYNGGYISIAHRSHHKRRLWSTMPGEAFISAGVAETEMEESRGSFVIKDGDVSFICNHQSVEEIKVLHQSESSNHFKGNLFPIVVITGWVFSKEKNEKLVHKDWYSGSKRFRFGKSKRPLYEARYWLILEQKTKNQIDFKVEFGDLNQQWRSRTLLKATKGLYNLKWKLVRQQSWRRGFVAFSSEDDTEEEKAGLVAEFNRVFITYESERDERFYGFGEQFSYVEFKGKRVPILVQEQGIGRGDQPITFAANLVSYRSGGDWSTTYAPSPFYMTSKMRSLYLEGYDYSVFDLRKHDRVQIQVHGSSVQGGIVNGTSPAELIENYTETIGRPPELPNWIVSGAVVGMQGGTQAVRNVWNLLKDHHIPVSAFWLQDWVGQRETVIGSQLWWNWELDNDQYAGWRRLVDDLRACNIQVMTYCNPCLVPTNGKMNRKRDLFEEAKSLGILVKDRTGETYPIPNTAFDVGMLDFTHPEASNWFKKILREMVDSGVRGWMADFGEGLPLDANLFSGEEPVAAHNRYPELWAKVNREFVDEWQSDSHEKESLIFFMRAGFRGSPKWSMLFWEGDQMVSWQKNDGIKSSVTGLLSGGLSGFACNHSDIGGYCAVNVPFIRYRRSEELLLRWMELNAFTTVFRTHEGNIPQSNCQFYSNNCTLVHFARFAKVYKAWEFYRIKLVKEAAEKGLPVVRHLFLHYPDDKHVQKLAFQQFLVGTEFLVVPVLDRGKKQVKAYFPTAHGHSWRHVWTGRTFTNSSNSSSYKQYGFEARVDAPIGFPAVFVKHRSPIGDRFVKNLRDLNIL